MAKKINLEFTETQLDSLVSIMDTIEATHGTADDGFLDSKGVETNYDTITKRWIKNLDRMLNSNGYQRT